MLKEYDFLGIKFNQFASMLILTTLIMCQLRQLQTHWKFRTDLKIKTHRFVQACMYDYLSVSLFLIVTFVTEPIGQFQHKIAKSILEKGELKSVKKKWSRFFFKRDNFKNIRNTLAN